MKRNFELKHIGSRWGIEVETEELGKVLLLNPYLKLPVAMTFDSRNEALDYIEEYKTKHSLK